MPKRKKGTPNPDAIVADEPATPSFGVGTGVGVQHPMTRHDCDGTLLANQFAGHDGKDVGAVVGAADSLICAGGFVRTIIP